MNLDDDCYELALLALSRAGINCDLATHHVNDADLLAEQIQMVVERYIENLDDGDDDTEEKRLDDAERARAINKER